MSDSSAPAGLLVPVGGKWAKSALRLRRVTRDGAWHLIDGNCGRTTAEQQARRYNLGVEYGFPWLHGYVEHTATSELWVKWVGPTSTGATA